MLKSLFSVFHIFCVVTFLELRFYKRKTQRVGLRATQYINDEDVFDNYRGCFAAREHFWNVHRGAIPFIVPRFEHIFQGRHSKDSFSHDTQRNVAKWYSPYSRRPRFLVSALSFCDENGNFCSFAKHTSGMLKRVPDLNIRRRRNEKMGEFALLPDSVLYFLFIKTMTAYNSV